MREKLQARAFEIVAPVLQPAEEPIMATRAMIGAFARGGLGEQIAARDGTQFVVVTDRRLIFLPQRILGGPGRKVLGEVPRDQVILSDVKMAVMSVVAIAFGTRGDGVVLTFPRQDQRNAKALVAALGNY
ncbi:hypothetical protein AB0M20_01390 [Actinoplanes sp. NPDC051633]|uniref:hypothetical protein n=1 Tax=Actinoplanes sp. NPDC051633 TaxID=3155670 RepID=UPI003434F137